MAEEECGALLGYSAAFVEEFVETSIKFPFMQNNGMEESV